ncbi:hypothetical protein JG688_00011006 [Phytophthora aleatoria]|uniref:Uncharacterized protein n=1 Tax=Phytophthora aleatoria TaxID=2496075 RepID=A0A8J5IHG7_9STRA|nr:hypothetical protein JG688_00011006 [Phytophthora aleatoria]
MDLLDAIQNAVIKQKEEETSSFFFSVRDFREFVVPARRCADVAVALKLYCARVERLYGARGTRLTLIDMVKGLELEASRVANRLCGM